VAYTFFSSFFSHVNKISHANFQSLWTHHPQPFHVTVVRSLRQNSVLHKTTGWWAIPEKQKTGILDVTLHIRFHVWYDMIYLLTASGLPPGGSCTINIYTQTIHRTTQNKQYIEQQKIWEQYKKFGRVRAVSRLGELYPGICLTTEEKARKNFSQGIGTIRIRKPNSKNT
jgi:hypothetical protein